MAEPKLCGDSARRAITSTQACGLWVQYWLEVKRDLQTGEVSEWPKEHAWKVCKAQVFEGSNPSLTANFKRTFL